MKRIFKNGILSVLILSLAVSLSACGSKEADSKDSETTEAVKEVKEETKEKKESETTTEAETTTVQEETTTEAETTTQEETTTEAETEPEEEKVYNPLTTLVYKDQKLDLSTCTYADYVKFWQQLGFSTVAHLGNEVRPYSPAKLDLIHGEAIDEEIYNPTGETIIQGKCKMLELEIDKEKMDKLREEGVYFLDGAISFSNTLDEFKEALLSAGYTTNEYGSQYNLILENGQEVTVDAESLSRDNIIIRTFSFEITPFYE